MDSTISFHGSSHEKCSEEAKSIQLPQCSDIVIAFAFALTAVGTPLVDSASGVGLFHTVTFVENDNSSDPVFATQAANTPALLTSIVALTPAFSNPGHIFDDWNTDPDGSGTSYANGSSYPFTASAALYAIWVGISHTVTFIENDSAAIPLTHFRSQMLRRALTVLSKINPAIGDPGYSFVDWNTAADGSGISYANGAVFDFSESTGLYAIWQVLPSVTQSFAANGGSGVIASLTSQAGDSTTLPLSSE